MKKNIFCLLFMLCFISSFSFAVDDEDPDKILKKRQREQLNEEALPDAKKQKIEDPAYQEEEYINNVLYSYSHKDFRNFADDKEKARILLNQILDPFKPQKNDWQQSIIDFFIFQIKNKIYNEHVFEMVMLIFLDRVDLNNTIDQQFENAANCFRSLRKYLLSSIRKSDPALRWATVFLKWRYTQKKIPSKARLSTDELNQILRRIEEDSHVLFSFKESLVHELNVLIDAKRERLPEDPSNYASTYRDYPYIQQVLNKHGLDMKPAGIPFPPLFVQMRNNYLHKHLRLNLIDLPQNRILPPLQEVLDFPDRNQADFPQHGFAPVQPAHPFPPQPHMFGVGLGAQNRLVFHQHEMPNPVFFPRIQPSGEDVTYWKQTFFMTSEYTNLGMNFESKRRWAQNNIPSVGSIHPRYNIENARDIDFNDPLFDQIISVYEALGYNQESTALKYLRSLEALCKYNILVTYEIAARGNVASTSSHLLYHGLGLNVVLHPEQSDANLEERAHCFYHILQSTWSEIMDIEDNHLREIMAKRLAEEALSSNTICMEGVSACIDAWYQKNKNLIRTGNLLQKYTQNYIEAKEKTSILAELYTDLEAQQLCLDPTYYQFNKESEEYIKIVESTPSGAKIKLGSGEISADFLKGMIADLKKRIDERRNQILERNAAQFGQIIKNILLTKKASDGEITLGDLYDIAQVLCIQIEFGEEESRKN